jgi:alanine dehydrogenase
MTDSGPGRFGAAMAGLAAFRIALGAASWIAPRRMARSYGLPEEQVTPSLVYMTRIFGVRAIALGVGYLASSGEGRGLWHRLWVLCDTADTIMGAGMVANGELGPKVGAGALVTTVPAMALDIAALLAAEDHQE